MNGIDKTKITNVETKVSIAADAGIAVHNYLDKLNLLLIEKGVNNAFGVVSDTQELIVDVLKSVGSRTKLGEDKVLEIIYKELGTPENFLNEYLDNYTTDPDQIDLDENSTTLVKRPSKPKKPKIKIETNFLSTLTKPIKFVYTILPVASLFGIYLFILSNGYNRGWKGEVIAIITGLSLGMYAFQELYSGVKGTLLLNVERSKQMRSTVKGLMLSNILLMTFGYLYALTRSINQLEHLGDFLMLVIWIHFALDAIIIFRDHKRGLFPLEHEFKPFVRFFTPHYLLLILPISVLLVPDFYYWNELVIYLFMLGPIFSAFIVFLKKYQMSIRYWLTIITLQLISVMVWGDLIPFVVIFPLYVLLNKLSKKMKINLPKRKGMLSVFDDYYDQIKNE